MGEAGILLRYAASTKGRAEPMKLQKHLQLGLCGQTLATLTHRCAGTLGVTEIGTSSPKANVRCLWLVWATSHGENDPTATSPPVAANPLAPTVLAITMRSEGI